MMKKSKTTGSKSTKAQPKKAKARRSAPSRKPIAPKSQTQSSGEMPQAFADLAAVTGAGSSFTQNG